MRKFKLVAYTLLLISFILAGLQSCEKDKIIPVDNKVVKAQSSAKAIIFNVGGQELKSKEEEGMLEQTQLGELRENPFTVQKMREAYTRLYDLNADEVIKETDIYVKFMPNSDEDMMALYDTDEFFYDYPLEYEVINMGEYYQEIEQGSYPILYAIVKPDFEFPEVSYEIIDDLYMDKSDPLLLAESFYATGNKEDINEYVFMGGLSVSEVPSYDGGTILTIRIPPVPETDCPPGYEWRLLVDDSEPTLNNLPVYIWECMPVLDSSGGNENACGCQTNIDIRKPGGCVKVEDTELSTSGIASTYEPVRRVKVIIKDTWLTEDEVWTDDNGCWQVDKRYYGRAWMWVKFKSPWCQIRGVASNWKAAYQWASPIKDYVGVIWGPNFNNIQVNYNMYNVQGSQAHRYWGAATVNNSVHEFHDYAAQDGIAPPPLGLDIYAGRNTRWGYALMSAQDGLSAAAGAAMGGVFFFTGPFAPLIAVIGWGGTKAYLPDVHIGINLTTSDNLKSLAYHELAHTSHYASVGSLYWEQLVYAEIFANGHGDQNSNNAELIGVCESWAEYLGGHLYVDRTYGGMNSLSFQGDTWERLLERTWNEFQNHVPIGLHNDLVDIGEPPINPIFSLNTACNQREAGCTVINDNVSGFTNAQMFSCLTPFTSTYGQYQDCLITNHLGSTSNTAVQVNALFNSY